MTTQQHLPPQTFGPGIISQTVPLDAQVRAGAAYYFTTTLDPADQADPTLTITITALLDDVQRFQLTWHGGQTNKNGSPYVPQLAFDSLDSSRPQRFTITADLSRALTLSTSMSYQNVVIAPAA